MVNGRDSSGRVVNLLNDGTVTAPISPVQRHHFKHRHQRSLTSTSLRIIRPRPLYSLPSTPSLSPQTSSIPPLSRSESNDSRLFPTPSPITPSFGGAVQDGPDPSLQPGKNTILAAPPRRAQLSRQVSDSSTLSTASAPFTFRGQDPDLSSNNATSAAVSVTSNGVSRHLIHANSDPGPSTTPTSDGWPTSTSPGTAGPQGDMQQLRLKKNQFPCPLAKLYDCPDFFTTSGHAARHAKKHTGKKDAFCPECNKAFTRKDNMEQHRRTHQTIKIPPTSIVAKDNRIKKTVSARPLNTHRLERSLTDSEILSASPGPDAMDYVPHPGSPALTSPASSRHYTSSLNSPVSAGLRPSHLDPSSQQPSPTEVPSPESQFGRPPLHRSNIDTSIAKMAAHRALDSPTSFAQPYPGLSTGLDALALVASDHRRRSDEEDDRRTAVV